MWAPDEARACVEVAVVVVLYHTPFRIFLSVIPMPEKLGLLKISRKEITTYAVGIIYVVEKGRKE